MLFTLDCRQIEADMKRIQAVIDGAEATLSQAKRDVERYTELAARNATPIVTLNNARTLVNVSKATAEFEPRAAREPRGAARLLRASSAPISGRISMANVKVGNFVRQADIDADGDHQPDGAGLCQLHGAAEEPAGAARRRSPPRPRTSRLSFPARQKPEDGQVSMIENTVDATTGMATIRATMPNTDEGLWPGTLVSVDLTLRSEDAVVVPSNAVQVSQAGSIVFVVDNNVAKVRHVTVERQVGDNSVITAGLKPGETVVTEGQLRLRNGIKVTTHGRNGGGPRKPRAAGS